MEPSKEDEDQKRKDREAKIAAFNEKRKNRNDTSQRTTQLISVVDPFISQQRKRIYKDDEKEIDRKKQHMSESLQKSNEEWKNISERNMIRSSSSLEPYELARQRFYKLRYNEDEEKIPTDNSLSMFFQLDSIPEVHLQRIISNVDITCSPSILPKIISAFGFLRIEVKDVCHTLRYFFPKDCFKFYNVENIVIQDVFSGTFGRIFACDVTLRIDNMSKIENWIMKIVQIKHVNKKIFQRSRKIQLLLSDINIAPRIKCSYLLIDNGRELYGINVMDRLHQTVADYLSRRTLTSYEISRLIFKIKKILFYLFDHNIVHGDLHISNLLFDSSFDHLYLIDFDRSIELSELQPDPEKIYEVKKYHCIDYMSLITFFNMGRHISLYNTIRVQLLETITNFIMKHMDDNLILFKDENDSTSVREINFDELIFDEAKHYILYYSDNIIGERKLDEKI